MLSLLLVVQAVPVLSQPHSAQQVQSFSEAVSSTQDLVEQGRIEYSNGKLTAAIALWQQAVQAYGIQADNLQQARVWSYLALAYHRLGQWTEATTAITTAFDLLEQHPAEQGERSPILAQSLTIRGQLELAQGQPEIALATWQQATALYQQLEDSVGIQGSLVNQVQAMEMMGLHRRACQTLLQSLQVNLECNLADLKNMEPILQAVTQQSDRTVQMLGLRSLGNVLRLLGYLVPSEQLLVQSQTLAQTLNSSRDSGASLLSLGDTRRLRFRQALDLFERTEEEGNLRAAEVFAQQALKDYQAVSQLEAIAPSLSFQSQVRQLGLLLELQQNDTWQAFDAVAIGMQIATLTQSLLTLQRSPLPASRPIIYAQVEFARLLAPVQWQQAAQVVQIAQQQALELKDVQAQSYAIGTLGHLEEIQSNWQTAQKLTESALLLAQSVQAWEIAQQWQWQLGRIHRAQGENQRAIAYYEAAVETLKSIRADLVAIDAEVQFSFREAVEPVYRELVELLLSSETTSTNAAISQNHLKQVIRTIDALRLSELENFLRCNLAEAVALEATPVDPQAAIFYPIILPNQLAVLLKLPQSEQLLLHTVSIAQSEVEQTLESLRYELEKPYIASAGLTLSQQVYDWLVRPFANQIDGSSVKTLVFILDGLLRSIPPATLHDGEHYLIESYAIAQSPGLQLLEPSPLAQQRLDVLSFGLSETRPDFLPHQDFASLENVETELAEIQAQIPSRTLINQEFTSSTLQQFVSTRSYPIVHLATHGQFSSTPEGTFILAWDKRVNVNDLSQILQSRDQSTSHPLELLVLSACKTAEGDRRAALGLAGVAIQSGARSIVASLWAVNDRATSELMSVFYRELANPDASVTRSEALRRAQVALLTNSGYRAPLFWAAFVLVGNWL